MIKLRDAIIRAWDNTEPCPDGVAAGAKFCPSCLYNSLVKLLEENAILAQTIHGERLGPDNDE
jgi:hypothetical protein